MSTTTDSTNKLSKVLGWLCLVTAVALGIFTAKWVSGAVKGVDSITGEGGLDDLTALVVFMLFFLLPYSALLSFAVLIYANWTRLLRLTAASLVIALLLSLAVSLAQTASAIGQAPWVAVGLWFALASIRAAQRHFLAVPLALAGLLVGVSWMLVSFGNTIDPLISSIDTFDLWLGFLCLWIAGLGMSLILPQTRLNPIPHI